MCVTSADSRKEFPDLNHPSWGGTAHYQRSRVSRTQLGFPTPFSVRSKNLKESGALGSSSYRTHIDRLTSARNCVILGHPEAWGSGLGCSYVIGWGRRFCHSSRIRGQPVHSKPSYNHCVDATYLGVVAHIQESRNMHMYGEW